MANDIWGSGPGTKEYSYSGLSDDLSEEGFNELTHWLLELEHNMPPGFIDLDPVMDLIIHVHRKPTRVEAGRICDFTEDFCAHTGVDPFDHGPWKD